MKLNKLVLALAIVVPVAGPAVAEESPVVANIGVVSDYLFRGITQTDGGAAIQGGLDYYHESGFYAGTWVSNVDFGTPDPNYELDLYAGYEGEAGDFGYSVGLLYYMYPEANTEYDAFGNETGDRFGGNYFDLDVSASWNVLTVGVTYTMQSEVAEGSAYQEGDVYYYGSVDVPLPVKGLSLGALVGYEDFDAFGSEGDYTHWQISLSKDAGDFGTFNLTYDQLDGGADELVAYDDDPRFWIGWTKEF